MVILNNLTRWNLIYDSITRAIQLYAPIYIFQIENKDLLGTDIFTREDWNELKELATFLRPFKDLIILL